jgi:hypothetical protein
MVRSIYIYEAKSPQDLPRLSSLSGEQILAVAYGYEVQGPHDHKVNAAKKMAELVSETALPGLLLVNDLPWRG